MDAYLKVLGKYAVFSGRARRREFWMFQLWQFVIYLLLWIAFAAIARAMANPLLALLPGLYGLATILPSLAVQVRRLHDTNHSGWAILIGLIPLAGAIILLVWNVQDGTPGDNRFGPSPKAAFGGSAAPAMGYVAPPLDQR